MSLRALDLGRRRQSITAISGLRGRVKGASTRSDNAALHIRAGFHVNSVIRANDKFSQLS